MEPITIYSTGWCPDCRRVKMFLKERGVEFREVNIEQDHEAEQIVLRANNGKILPRSKSLIRRVAR